MLAPICLFTYNRLNETKATVESLRNNYLAKDSNLIIFSDGPKDSDASKKVIEVRNFLKQINGFKSVEIIESDENKGLANSIISGVTQVLNYNPKTIVLEDDLITTPNFLNFMNQALKYYEDELKIQSISGYSLNIKHLMKGDDIYFQKRPFSWGWSTWSDRWTKCVFSKVKIKNEIDKHPQILQDFKKNFGNDMPTMLIDSINDVNDSWYARWTFDHYIKKSYTVYPSFSLVENIGYGADSSTHCKGINSYNYKLDRGQKEIFDFFPLNEPPDKITKEFLRFYTKKHKILHRIKLAASSAGRRELLSEINMRLSKQK